MLPWNMAAATDYFNVNARNLVVKESPWVDVRAHLPTGYVTDGSVDYSTQLQAAVDNAATRGTTLFIPDMILSFGTTINVPSLKPLRIAGVLYTGGIADPGNNSYDSFQTGTRLKYTGTGDAFYLFTTRSITFENLTLMGPGRGVPGSRGIHGSYSSTTNIYGCLIFNFDTGLYLDGANGDLNTIKGSRINNVNIGVDLVGSQNYINLIIDTAIIARICIRNGYSTRVTVIGGGHSPAYSVLYHTTIASVSGQNVTLDNGANLINGMQMVMQNNAYTLGDFIHPYSDSLHYISGVTGNQATLDGYVATTHSAGDNVVYGYFPKFFDGANLHAFGIHIEAGNNVGCVLAELYSYGRLYSTITDSSINLATTGIMTDALNKWTKLLMPTIQNSSAGTPAQSNVLYLSGVDFTGYFPKIIGSSAYLHRNTWLYKPILWGNASGYFSQLETKDDVYYTHWGDPTGGSSAVESITQSLGSGFIKSVAGSELPILMDSYYLPSYYTKFPTKGYYGSQSAAVQSSTSLTHTHAKIVNTNGSGIYDNTAITDTGNISSGSNKLTVSTVNTSDQLYEGRWITVAGAGGGGGTLTSQIMFISGFDNVVYLHDNAGTTVTGAVLAGIAPNWKKFGRQAEFGTAAPTTGTWAVGDITWNTAADNVVLWKCTVAGTPGTWSSLSLP